MKNYKIGIIIFSMLAIGVSLFPPFEWNHSIQGVSKSGSSYFQNNNSVYFNYHSNSFKTYEFLFNWNRKDIYSNITHSYESFNRSIIISELIIEYLLAGFISLLIQVIFNKNRRQ